MTELEVKVPTAEQKNYKVNIGTGILGSVWEKIQAAFKQRPSFVITDENLVSAGHLEKLVSPKDVPSFVISPPGETSKHIHTVISIIEQMEKAYLGRDSLIIALGGGTVGDIAGFAAAIFKRGVPVVQIPTTTVAQADSAIGGKTGVDSTLSKNAFGAFWHPAAVYVDVQTLHTLEDRQFRAGLVESVKHALIADAAYFDFLESNLDKILRRDYNVLETLAEYNCRTKAGIVEADPLEKNQRRMLNYGHTIGHAVEFASGYQLLHGEAIAIGMIGAGLIEIELGLGRPQKMQKVREILLRLGMPLTLPAGLTTDRLLPIIRHDKKAIKKWPRFVLTDKIGQVYCPDGQWAVPVEQEVVETVLDKLR